MNNIFYPINAFNNDKAPVVEFIDTDCKTLIIAPITHAPRLKLGYKVVWVQLVDSNRRIYLSRRASHLITHPNLWDFSASGYILAGESCEDAALRELLLCFGIDKVSLSNPRSYFFPLQENFILSTLYTVSVMTTSIHFCYDYIQDGMFLDEDELTGFSSELSEFLTPSLLWAIHNKIIF